MGGATGPLLWPGVIAHALLSALLIVAVRAASDERNIL
jgi:hypothetical protein